MSSKRDFPASKQGSTGTTGTTLNSRSFYCSIRIPVVPTDHMYVKLCPLFSFVNCIAVRDRTAAQESSSSRCLAALFGRRKHKPQPEQQHAKKQKQNATHQFPRQFRQTLFRIRIGIEVHPVLVVQLARNEFFSRVEMMLLLMLFA